MQQELVDIVDETGKVLHQAFKHEAHQHGWLHKTVIGSVRLNGQWMLIRQAADRQDAGQYVWPVGGHVQAGEGDVEALIREAKEEIGVQQFQHTFKGAARFHRQIIGRDENHLFLLYEITTKDTITPGPEVESHRTFNKAELTRTIGNAPHQFGDAYFFVLEHFYPELLPNSYRPRHK